MRTCILCIVPAKDREGDRSTFDPEGLSTTNFRSRLSMRVFRSASIILLASVKPNTNPTSPDLEYLKQTGVNWNDGHDTKRRAEHRCTFTQKIWLPLERFRESEGIRVSKRRRREPMNVINVEGPETL